MELFNPKSLRFDFTKYFKVSAMVSLIACGAVIVSMFYPGLNYGIDFRGGIETQIRFTGSKTSQVELRDLLDSKLQNLSIVNFSDSPTSGAEFLITAQSDAKESISKTLSSALESKYGVQGETTWQITKMDVVGPKIGSELRKSAILSLIYTCLLITLYMYWRFDMRFTPGALACIFHDLILTTGFLILTRAEFSSTIVAALLTLAGYSINDTVVVFDRIRETEGKLLGKSKSFVVNEAINSTLSRTIMTAGATLMACVVLYFIGGPTLKDFSAALFVGILVGTYSSAFVAAPLFLWTDNYFSQKSQAKVAVKV
jgi:preprotein translocase subunit SecF